MIPFLIHWSFVFLAQTHWHLLQAGVIQAFSLLVPFLFPAMLSTQQSVYWARFTSIKADTVSYLASISCTAPLIEHINWELEWVSPLHTELNWLALETRGSHFPNVFFKLIWWIDILSTSCKIGLGWVHQNSIDDKSTLVQVMAWCRQTTSHYQSQC